MRTRHGITILESVLLVSLILLLTGLLVPIRSYDGHSHGRSSCGNNQRQIVLAMLVYANENDGAWPCRPTSPTGAALLSPRGSLFTTIGTFEFLAAQTGKEMPAKVFACPSEPTYKPRMAVNASLDCASGISAWCADAAAQSAQAVRQRRRSDHEQQ